MGFIYFLTCNSTFPFQTRSYYHGSTASHEQHTAGSGRFLCLSRIFGAVLCNLRRPSLGTYSAFGDFHQIPQATTPSCPHEEYRAFLPPGVASEGIEDLAIQRFSASSPLLFLSFLLFLCLYHCFIFHLISYNPLKSGKALLLSRSRYSILFQRSSTHRQSGTQYSHKAQTI